MFHGVTDWDYGLHRPYLPLIDPVIGMLFPVELQSVFFILR